MGVTIEVKEGSVAEITGPAKIVVTSDVPGSVLIDGEPVVPTSPPEPPPAGQAPTVSSLNPATAVAGDATDIEMTVTGTGFANGVSTIVFDGNDEPTTFISATQVSTGVRPSLFVVPADCPVAVRNGSLMSNEQTFTFTASAGTQQRRK